jgi:hypothetical protein
VGEYVSSVRQGGFERVPTVPKAAVQMEAEDALPKFEGIEIRSDRLLFRVCQAHELGTGALIWVYEGAFA